MKAALSGSDIVTRSLVESARPRARPAIVAVLADHAGERAA
jgi:hypothetical protein